MRHLDTTRATLEGALDTYIYIHIYVYVYTENTERAMHGISMDTSGTTDEKIAAITHRDR